MKPYNNIDTSETSKEDNRDGTSYYDDYPKGCMEPILAIVFILIYLLL